MLEFFTGLTGPIVVFYAMAILASLVLVVQIVMMAFGFDDLGDVEGLDAGDGLSLISFRSLTGFFGGFGWAGVLMLENGSSMVAATGVGFGVGLVLMVSVAYVMKVLHSLKESGTIDFAAAIGEVGTVYVSIPAAESGGGQVRVMVQGRLKVVPAYTKSSTSITSERKVRVVALVDSGTLLVEPLGETVEKES